MAQLADILMELLQVMAFLLLPLLMELADLFRHGLGLRLIAGLHRLDALRLERLELALEHLFVLMHLRDVAMDGLPVCLQLLART